MRLLSKFLTQARERKSRQKQPLGRERGPRVVLEID